MEGTGDLLEEGLRGEVSLSPSGHGALELLGVVGLRRLVPLRVTPVLEPEVVLPEVLRRCVLLRQFRQLLPVLHPDVRVRHVEVLVETALVPVVPEQTAQTVRVLSLL